MIAKGNGDPAQGGADVVDHGIQSTLGDNVERDTQHRFREAVHEIDMREFMPTAEIERGKKGNPLWRLARRVITLQMTFLPNPDDQNDLIDGPTSPRSDFIFSRWYDAYCQQCSETQVTPDCEEDLWMMWSNALATTVVPENSVKLAADLAREQPLPTDARLFEELPKMQSIVATLVMLARITKQGGLIAFTCAQLGDALCMSGDTVANYISKLQNARSPLLCRIKKGKPTEPSGYLLLSPEILRWSNLPDSAKRLVQKAPPSPQLEHAKHLLRRHQ
jgi:hypothetical protein